MKKLLLAAMIAVLAVANSANAKIYRTERYWAESDPFNMMPSSKRNQLVSGCADLGYLNAPPAGKTCTTIQNNGLTCYKDCKCPSTHTKACKGTGEKGVGTKCDDLYASCTCEAKFKYCSGTEDGGGDVCTADGGYKYSECTCSNVYKEKCDGVGVVGVDAPCGGLYKSCKCDSAYKYCTSGTEGDGEACTYDGGSKFKYCNTVAVEEVDNGENGSGKAMCEWNDGNSYIGNDFANMKGLLFDGQSYTISIIEQVNKAGVHSLAADAANAYSPYLEQKLVAEDSEYFKQGQWYLPSQGEMLQMYGCDWDKIARILQEGKNKEQIANGDFVWLGGACDGHNLAKLQNTFGEFRQLGVVDELDELVGEKYWTSSVDGKIGKDKVVLVDFNNNQVVLADRAEKYSVRPVARVWVKEGFFKGAKIGQVVTKKLQILNPVQAMDVMWDEDPVMGMIYWVSPDGGGAKVVAMQNARVDGKPSTTKPWAGEEHMIWGKSYAYENMPTNAWTCTGDEAEEPVESNDCNDYNNYTGPLFDGQANTDAILDVWGCDVDDPKASEAKAACAVHSFYPILQGVEKDHPIFGQGKWYLPSVGELMLMETDWNKVVGNLEAISAKWNEGDFNFMPYDLWQSGNTETFDAVDTTFQELYGFALDEKFFTSNEVNEEFVVMVRLTPGAGIDGIAIQSTPKESATYVLPIIKLAADKLNSSSGEEARPGMVVDKDMKFGNLDELEKDMVVGIIFFVSPDGKTVWIMHRPLGDDGDGEFDPENPYDSSEDRRAFIFSPNGDVPGIKNDPWTCSGDLTSCTDGNDYQKFTGPLFDGKANTQKLVAARGEEAQAAWLASQFYPHGDGGVKVDEGDELFGRGKWYLPSAGELMMLTDMDWNLFAQAVNNLNDEKRNDPYTLNELAATYSNKELSKALIPAVEVLKEKWPDVNYIVENYNVPMFSSSEVGDGENIYMSYKAKHHLKSQVFGDESYLLPAVQLKTENLDKMGYEPEVGYFVGASRKYYDSGNAEDIDDIVGIIYWVSEDKQTLRVISPRAIGNGVENPFNSDPKIVFDTEGEVADVIAKSVDYIYGEKQCTVIEGGEAMQPTCQASSVNKTGYNNTQAIIAQIGDKGLAAMACATFYAPGVSYNDKTFGQNKWYLPSIGELMQLYGTDFTKVTEASGESGAKGDNIAVISNALTILSSKGVDATTLTYGWYWSSSESNSYTSWVLTVSNGYRGGYMGKNLACSVRAFQLCENCFTPLCLSPTAVPQIGDVMYADKTFGKASDYDGKKTPVGVITWVSDDGASAKIISLKNLTFTSKGYDGNFDPDNPYGNAELSTLWATEDAKDIDITGVENCTTVECLLASVDSTSLSGSGSSSGGSGGGSPEVTCTSPKTNVGGSCQCPASYSQTCTAPQTGVGEACDGKYESCQCPASYSQTCTSPKEGVGEACGGKYESCQCPTSYVTCEAPYEGVGEACEGKYASCVSPYVEVGEYQGGIVRIAKKDSAATGWTGANNDAASKGGILPSIGLLQWVYNNKAAINSTLQANGGVAFSNVKYWSSDIYRTGSYKTINMGNGKIINTQNGTATKYRIFQVGCPASYVTCEAPYEGVGEACYGKYESCQCPESYANETCEAPYEAVGQACDGKYVCALSYVEVGTYNGQRVFVARANADSTLSWTDAVKYATSKGGILPDIELLQWVYNNKATVNKKLQANGGVALVNYAYWSSTSGSSGKYWRLSMDNGSREQQNKTYPGYVRPFKLE